MQKRRNCCLQCRSAETVACNAEVQKLLPAMQRCSGADHHAFFQDLMISSCLVDVSPSREYIPVCISSKDARMVKRAARKGELVCKYVCEHHPEIVVVDRWLWRKLWWSWCLPNYLCLVSFSFVIPQGLGTQCGNPPTSEEPSQRSTLNYTAVWGRDGENNERIWTRVHDTKEWVFVELASIPETFPDYCDRVQISHELWVRDHRFNDGYRNSMYASYGGLICFVPNNTFDHSGHHLYMSLKSYPILVCNPLTSVWKFLPLIPLDDLENTTIITVQLVLEDDTKCYKVILVIHEKNGEALATHLYSSKTGIWSIMDCGFFYGVDSTLMSGSRHCVPYVFDCATKTVFDLREYVSFEKWNGLAYSMGKDHLFVLFRSDNPIVVEGEEWGSICTLFQSIYGRAAYPT